MGCGKAKTTVEWQVWRAFVRRKSTRCGCSDDTSSAQTEESGGGMMDWIVPLAMIGNHLDTSKGDKEG